LPEPVQVSAGTEIALHLRGKCDAQRPVVWVWDTAVRRNGNTIAEYRQSTFFAQLLSPEATRQKVRSND